MTKKKGKKISKSKQVKGQLGKKKETAREKIALMLCPNFKY